MKYFQHALRLALTLTFAFAAVLKVRDPRAFFDAIQTYHLLERFPAGVVAIWLPWLELVLAFALWLRKYRRIASGMIAALCVVFLAALLQAWFRGIDISCGCFGSPDQVQGPAYLGYIARDIGLLVVAIVLWKLDAKAAPGKSGAASQP